MSGPGTLEDALARLGAVCGGTAPKPTAVMDAGIATEENIAWLAGRGHDWTAVSRGAGPAPPEGGPEAPLVTGADREVRAWRLAGGDGEARLHVVSKGGRKTGTATLGLRRNRFEAAPERLNGGLPARGRPKRYDRVLESVGRLRQRFSAVARHYGVTVEKAKTGPNATAVRFRRRPRYDAADGGAGAYALRTGHVDWDIETVLRTYWRITTRLRQTDGAPIVNRQDTRPAAGVAAISSAAGVDPAIHRTRTRLTN